MARITFRRYTNLVSGIQILRQRAITLLNPELWDDRNDSYGLLQYMNALEAKSILALCFAERHETYHHWRVFSPGMDGLCIEFDKAKLLQAFACVPGGCVGSVKYYEIQELKETLLTVEQLPFVKRFPYRDEREFRLIDVDMDEELDFKSFPITLDCIRRINLSPWMPKSMADSVRATIRMLPGCERLSINRSTLVDNDQWKARLDCAIPSDAL